MSFLLKDYDFELPEELIAQEPIFPRHASRLMIVNRAKGTLELGQFSDFPALLDSGDLLVANNSRVMRSRLLGQRLLEGDQLGGKFEFFLLEQKGPLRWEGLFNASVRGKVGVRFSIPTQDGGIPLIGTVVRSSQDSPVGAIEVEFDRDPMTLNVGEIPLPPYIHRRPTDQDTERYQTVYSKDLGSSAAPTAGLHFSPEILQACREKGIRWAEATLHVGLGTFRPVSVDDVRNHVIHEEAFRITPELSREVALTREVSRRIVAVGTTSLRALESAWNGENLEVGTHRSNLFLYPGGPSPRLVNALVTNFHLPKSSLLLLVSSFAGVDLIRRAYELAVRERFRFFSYGDAMLIV